jgi:hypothetical protein
MARQPLLGFQSLPGPRSTQVCKSSPAAGKNPFAPLPSLVVLGNAHGTCLVCDLFAAEAVNRTGRNQFEWTEDAAVRHPCSCDYCTAAFDVVISCTALPVSPYPYLPAFSAFPPLRLQLNFLHLSGSGGNVGVHWFAEVTTCFDLKTFHFYPATKLTCQN